MSVADRAAAWSEARRVLAIRLDRLGDVLMTTPAIRALRGDGLERSVTLLCSTPGAEAAPFIPEIDGAIVYDAPWMKATPPRDDATPDLRFIERLRSERFDAAVVFTAYSQDPLPAALMCHLAGIPLRLAHCRENPYQLLTDWVPDAEPSGQLRHEVRRQLDLVSEVGLRTADERLSFQPAPAARARVRRLLETLGLDRIAAWVVIHPGSSAPSRRYPTSGFEEVARRVAANAGWHVVVTGSEEEREPALRVAHAAGPGRGVSLAGRLSLEELAALIASAPLLISNNTGPVHLAAAAGTPVVDLYALTNPQHTPWGVPSRVLYRDVPCRFCYKSVCPEGHHACLVGVSPDEVVAAALELVAASAPERRWTPRTSGAVSDPPLAAVATAVGR